jgi:hypothetical protein
VIFSTKFSMQTGETAVRTVDRSATLDRIPEGIATPAGEEATGTVELGDASAAVNVIRLNVADKPRPLTPKAAAWGSALSLTLPSARGMVIQLKDHNLPLTIRMKDRPWQMLKSRQEAG